MKRIYETIMTQIPKDISGFSCVKTQEILIPYLEIGVECLIRDISELNLFFETILKLVEIEVKDILDISSILGVTAEITKEAIVDMVSSDYISVSENILKITKKGEEALKTKKRVEIKKKNLSKVMVDLITGDIYDGSQMKIWKANKSSVCLDNEITVDKPFLDTNFTLLNHVFMIQQENDSVFGRVGVTKELYKIVDIYYRNLVYIKNEVLIYKSDDTDEIQLIFASDNNNKLTNFLYSQLKEEIHPCLENFFERNNNFVTKQSACEYSTDQVLLEATNKLKEELRYKDKEKDINIGLFQTRRYSIVDKEYTNYFIFSDELMYERLFIQTNRINSLLNDEIFSEIAKIADKKKVFIIYDKNEFRATESINHYMGRAVNSKNIFIIPQDNIVTTFICFESALKIDISEYIIRAFNKPISFKVSIIDFESDKLKVCVDEAINKYDIESLIQDKKSINGKSGKKNKFYKKS